MCANPTPSSTNHAKIPSYTNPNSNFTTKSHSQMFNPSQDSTNLTYHIPYQSNTINPNSNKRWLFPPPVFPSAVAFDPALRPPGTEPNANSGSYSWTHVVFQAQTPFVEDPNAGSQNGAIQQAEPIGHEASIKFLNESLLVPTTSNSLWNSNGTNRCDVCNLSCSSKENYEAHILGKKHQKKIRMQYNPTAAASNVLNNISLPSQTSSVGGQVIFGGSGVAAGVELETKRRKVVNGGAADDSMVVCTICNVVCNSQEVYIKHLAGKRHKAQASLVAPNVGSYFAALQSEVTGIWNKDPNKIKLVQSAWCEVCKVSCNSNDTYIKHLVGKKHQKNLEQLEKLKNDGSASTSNVPSAATNAIIGPMENLGAKGSQPEEDLETKKRKIISGGAAAGAVRTCTVCNVVCNSQTVFNSHLAGQKHAAMVKKQAEVGVAIRASQQITAS
ncbi:hypothetical protein PRUPE_5G201200 [Prunus persica]|uniref:C2H2-type domain-containing protein n=1 Tax=Prunus persica TaxID=3760 RepID=A0A251PB32_PRUPE|nr:zinc finger RNA-binding protein [Prunus persica]ONI08797.1 hypothetical protein PRUPE_5G201200 [Prunus persica]ONI08798.1 hypothetical protein PRUPE_5G201200 [Prunus persica]